MKSLFKIRAESAGKPKSVESIKIAYFYALIIIVIALAQLFTFDEFSELLISFGFPIGELTGKLAASFIVIFEVLSLPFILRLKLSKLMRYTSMVFSWMIPAFWLIISLWLLFTDNQIDNIGILGTVIELMPGWWAVFISIALGFASAWVSWGLWPEKQNSKK